MRTLVLISWDGNVNDASYLVREDQVERFMEKFNEHGMWQVVRRPVVYLDNI